MPSRFLRSLRVAALALLAGVAAFALPAGAQTADPVDDLITRVIFDLNDLRYADAIKRGRDVLATTRGMRAEQEGLLRSAIAAAYYPEEANAQQPDSAIAQFVAGLKVVPDLALPIELRWDGLDSLLTVARSRTLAVVVTMDEQSLSGPEGRGTLAVHVSRPARVSLRTNALGSAALVWQDSSAGAATRSTLQFRAHDGRNVLLATGEYVATIVATDPVTGDSTLLTRRMLVEGARLMLVAPPSFDSTKLRRETVRAPLVRTAITALAFGTATILFGSLGGDKEFGDDFEPDGRAVFVGFAIVGAGIGSYWLDKGKSDPEAVAANAALRDEHRKAVDAAAAESERRIREYRVTVTLAPESR
jgi:hypothetical protein